MYQLKIFDIYEISFKYLKVYSKKGIICIV